MSRAWVTALLLLPFTLYPLPFATAARAQDDVVELLVRQRSAVRAAELLRDVAGPVTARAPAPLGDNTIYWLWHDRVVARRRARADSLARAPVTLAEVHWDKVEPDEQEPFLDAYGEAFWFAAPSQPALDTVATPRWRALLNGLFGAPTRNAAAAEELGYAGSEFVQFEYWFVVNDTIPVLVLDRDGPFGRGLLVAGDEEDRRYLPLLSRDLAARLAGARPTPYADYYHAYEEQQWYQTGFDGAEYYVKETRRPRWAGDRRRNDRWRIFR